MFMFLFYLKKQTNQLLLSKSINLINQYCARLPSDYLTSLTPRWRWHIIPYSSSNSTITDLNISCGIASELKSGILYQCFLRLPINSPLKNEISVGLLFQFSD